MSNSLNSQELSRLPKVAIELTEAILSDNNIRQHVDAGWYAVPVVKGMPMISDDLLLIAIRQTDQTIACKAAYVHNTYDGKLSEDEAIHLQASMAGLI